MNIVFCSGNNFTVGDGVAMLVDIFANDYVSVILLNTYWMMTMTSSFIYRVVIYFFFVDKLDYPYDELIYPLVSSWLVQIIIVYMWEKIHKTLYISMKRNENLHS
jgi:hypothetical protein